METTSGRGGAAMSPSYTPRSNKPTRHRDRGPLPLTTISSNLDSKGGAAASGAVNIQVLLRFRPSSEEERCINAPIVITCNDQKREVSVAHNIANKQIDGTLTRCSDQILHSRMSSTTLLCHLSMRFWMVTTAQFLRTDRLGPAKHTPWKEVGAKHRMASFHLTLVSFQGLLSAYLISWRHRVQNTA